MNPQDDIRKNKVKHKSLLRAVRRWISRHIAPRRAVLVEQKEARDSNQRRSALHPVRPHVPIIFHPPD